MRIRNRVFSIMISLVLVLSISISIATFTAFAKPKGKTETEPEPQPAPVSGKEEPRLATVISDGNTMVFVIGGVVLVAVCGAAVAISKKKTNK